MAQNQFPEKVRIGPIDYEVAVCKIKDLGRYDNAKSKISINQDTEFQQQLLTLFHEATHAILFEAGLEEYDNEILVNVFSAGMFSFLRDNPKLLAHFKK